MTMTPEDVAELLQREGSGVSPNDYDETKETQEARSKRTESLKNVLETCQQASQQQSSTLEAIAKSLGDGSRDVAWRLPYGESGILEFFLEILASSEQQSHGVKIHALRITGNSCADTDENRARVVDGKFLVPIMDHLQDENLIPYLIPVLYNILVDYEPAQLLASQSRLSSRLISRLQSPTISEFSALILYFCKILDLLVTRDGEPAAADPQTVQVLLSLATSPLVSGDVDDFISLVSTAASYLANEKFQENVLKGQQMDVFMKTFDYAHTQFDGQVEDQATATVLRQLCTSLLTTLADLTGNDAFATYYPLDSSVPQSLLQWLKGSHPNLQSAACLALGNLSRSDEVSLGLIQTLQVHRPLMATLSDPSVTDAQQLHSALSFLKNLAIPAQNKPLLGDLLEPASIPRILTIDTLPQVQFSAVSLVRLLLVNCAANVRRICTPRSSGSEDSSSPHTSVHDILSLFDRSDTEPTRLEAARSVAAVCRVLHTTPVLEALPEWNSSQNDLESEANTSSDTDKEIQARSSFYAKHDLSKALSFLVTQEKWSILRSEAWFVFALMSRSKDGAQVVTRVLEIPEAAGVLSRAVTGQSTTKEPLQLEDSSAEASPAIPEGLGLEPQQVDPKQQANMAKVDRENCLVLCTEISKNGDNLNATQLTQLKGLIREGTELLTQDKTGN
ncbi:hypothetical protein FZEAL_5585 [Fusarium zealandicum]|uniref:GTP binding protein n=1 Tax=Fusarium zealandicum TaxID=1053134 RepID=A0A8H4UJG7_9HYPO|nr:hypothetical protein FZEAL_5585 [Fusarium zealandicum]